jgi:serine/threonine protein kinase/CRP-like cAMP-binding protein
MSVQTSSDDESHLYEGSTDDDDQGINSGSNVDDAAISLSIHSSSSPKPVPSAFRQAQKASSTRSSLTGSISDNNSTHSVKANRRSSQTKPGNDLHVTPPSAAGSKKRLSAKLAERFSRFEGETLSPLPPAISQILEGNSDTELSPLHFDSSQHRTSKPQSHNYPPDKNLTLSAGARKRSIRTSLVGRVKVFDSPKKQTAKLLLSPKEVRRLVASASTRVSGIKQNFEQQRKRVREQSSKKEQQRKMLLQVGSAERRAKWEATKSQFDHHNNGYFSMGVVHQDVHAKSFNFDGFVPPRYGDKTEEQRQLILETVDRNFVFSEFRVYGKARTNESIEALIQAFQPVSVKMGIVLWHQTMKRDGKITKALMNDDGQVFYIVQEGAVAFHTNGVSVGTLAKSDGFGEQSLLHPAPSTVTASVALDSSNQGKTAAQLLKLAPQSYRGLLHMYSKQAEEEKREALLQVDFLNEILVDDEYNDKDIPNAVVGPDHLLHSLASIMIRVEFTKDQVFDAPEDVTFFVIQSGETNVKNKSGALDMTLKSGDYFGERALIGSLPRRSLVTTQTTMTACSDRGVFFRIDRVQMESILGPSRVQKYKDIHRLASTSLMKRAKWSHKTKSSMVDKIIEHKLEAPNTIMNVKRQDKPAVYVVQEGVVKVSYEGDDRESQTLKAGDTFGHDQLEETKDDKGKTTIYRKAGLKAELSEGKSASIGVLEVRKLSDSSHHSIHSIPKVSSKSSHSNRAKNATLELRDKVRKVVKEGASLEDFEKISLLGEGDFGEVWLVAADIFHTGDSNLRQKFALKSQHKVDELRGKDAAEAIRREIDIMRDIQHSQVVDLVQTFEDEENLYMLVGLIPGGELWDRVYQETDSGDWSSGLSEEHAKFYTMVIADTLGFIHSRQYIYRDLKPENVMIDSDGYPVIVDFGCSKHCPDQTFTFCGTPNYVSPEIIKNAGHNRCVDHWALGITLYEMITGENPFYFDGMDQVTLYDCICQEPHFALTIGKGHSSDLIDLVDQLLEKDPANRLGMQAGGIDDILEHPWFEGLDLRRIRAKRWPAPWKPERNADDNALEEGLMERMGLRSIPVPNLNDSFNDLDSSFASIAEEDDLDLGNEGGDAVIETERLSPAPRVKPKRPKGGTKKKTKTKSVPITDADFKFVVPQSQLVPESNDLTFYMENPKNIMSAAKKKQSKSRRSAISETLAGLGIDSDDEYQLF